MDEADATFNSDYRPASALDNSPPITITYNPATHIISNATVGTNIIINATATDPDGNIAHCQFMVQFEGKTFYIYFRKTFKFCYILWGFMSDMDRPLSRTINII